MRYSASDKQPKVIAVADSTEFFEYGMTQHSACQACRERKLKCNGQKPSCERCTNGGVICQYPTERRRRRTAVPSSDTDQESGKKARAFKSSSAPSPVGSVSVTHQQLQSLNAQQSNVLQLGNPISGDMFSTSPANEEMQVSAAGDIDFASLGMPFPAIDGAAQSGAVDLFNQWTFPGKLSE